MKEWMDIGTALDILRILRTLLLPGILICLCRFLYILLVRERQLHRSVGRACRRMQESSEQLQEEGRVRKLLYGETEEKDLFSAVNSLLLYSGVKGALPWANPLLFLAGLSFLSLLAFTAVFTVTGSLAAGAAAVPAALFLPCGVLIFLKDRNYRRTEKDILPFMNLVENYSFSSDDLLEILESAGRMVGNPVRGETAAAVLQARRSGNPYLAIRLLREAVEYPHFKRLIGNLERCSRGTADYRTIIAGSRKTVERSLSHDKEIREVHKNGRGELFMMLGMGAALVPIMGSVSDSGKNLYELLNGSLAGKSILAALCVIVALSIWFCVFGMRKHR